MTGDAEQEAARLALRLRQGVGARYDAPSAPGPDLLLARRGTAYLARKLNDLADADLDGASLREGWRRRRLIAYVCYHARALALLLEGVRTGVETRAPPSAEARAAEIELGATLPPRALRSLFRHTEIHLNVEWRDLSDQGWDAALQMFEGRAIVARDTPRIRAIEVWRSALELGNGGRRADAPSCLFADL